MFQIIFIIYDFWLFVFNGHPKGTVKQLDVVTKTEDVNSIHNLAALF